MSCFRNYNNKENTQLPVKRQNSLQPGQQKSLFKDQQKHQQNNQKQQHLQKKQQQQQPLQVFYPLYPQHQEQLRTQTPQHQQQQQYQQHEQQLPFQNSLQHLNQPGFGEDNDELSDLTASISNSYIDPPSIPSSNSSATIIRKLIYDNHHEQAGDLYHNSQYERTQNQFANPQFVVTQSIHSNHRTEEEEETAAVENDADSISPYTNLYSMQSPISYIQKQHQQQEYVSPVREIKPQEQHSQLLSLHDHLRNNQNVLLTKHGKQDIQFQKEASFLQTQKSLQSLKIFKPPLSSMTSNSMEGKIFYNSPQQLNLPQQLPIPVQQQQPQIYAPQREHTPNHKINHNQSSQSHSKSRQTSLTESELQAISKSFHARNLSWSQAKDKRIAQSRNLLTQQEIIQEQKECTFKPAILEKSRQMSEQVLNRPKQQRSHSNKHNPSPQVTVASASKLPPKPTVQQINSAEYRNLQRQLREKLQNLEINL